MPRTTDDLPVLFLVPARGGSVRIPAKNLRTVAGIPLVGRAVRVARAAAASTPSGPHAVVCSTDDEEIAAVAAAWHAEVPFRRPAELASASATSLDVALHALDALEAEGRRFRAVVLLQPTSPLTDAADVAAALAGFDATGRPAVSVTPTHPVGWHVGRDEAGLVTPTPDPGAGYVLTGAFYVVSPEELRAGLTT
jgi:CMP-N-acetylneuraminic acid synthetase